MLLLPPIRWSQRLEGRSVRLPCPAGDWIQLIAEQTTLLAPVIRANPSLFLFACENYCAQSGRCVPSWPALLEWCEAELPRQLIAKAQAAATPSVSSSVADPIEVRRQVRKWMKGSGNTSVPKKMAQFVAAATGLRFKDLRHDVPDWLPARMTMARIAKQDVDGKKQRKRFASRWAVCESSSTSELVQRLLRLKQQSIETGDDFEARLQQQKLQAMKQLAYGASHEINNPLANIATRAQTLVQSEQDLSRRQKLATIHEQAMRAHEMISDMMLFANPPALKLQDTDLTFLIPSIIRDIETSLANQAAFHDKSIDFQLRLGPNLPLVSVDPTQFSVLVHSLVKNSMEAIESSGSIEVSVRCHHGKLVTSVVDDGNGVRDLALEHLFDPFFSGREAGRGLGFGLSKAWRIAQLHGATLQHDATHTPGAKFVFTLPLGKANLGEANLGETNSAGTPNHQPISEVGSQ